MDQAEIDKLTERVKAHNTINENIQTEIAKVVFGAEGITRTLLRALLTGGHVLLEGLPGLAKTMLAETFANLLGINFKRIQFTPDLLPADLTGAEILNPKDVSFSTRKGPIFTNVLLSDEINRAPAKVQSALLEAMAEQKVTIGLETFQLSEPFMVLATQNPIEQEGTYPLPEAQMDRFMFKVIFDYPSKEDEIEMLEKHGTTEKKSVLAITNEKEILEARTLCDQIYVDEKLKTYIVDLVRTTRNLKEIDESMASYVDLGASPRAGLALLKGAKANAFLDGRGFTIPEDVREIATQVLRHRILLSYAALAEDVDSTLIINTLVQKVEVP